MKRFTIKLDATLNGGKCKNPKITFIQNDDGCTLYPCEINEKTGEITIEILDGCPQNACIEGFIECEGDCVDCKTYFKKCLCVDLDEITDPCKKCIDGFVEDVCTPEQLAKGYVCLNGDCVCPPSKPYKHPVTGECVECLDGMTQGCLVCINGKWTDKECPDGVCDPATGDCVECLDSADCGPNKICVNGKCVCAPGYVDDGKGNCIPRPKCTDSSDCGPCEICINGNCEPLVCPEGFICDPNINDCVPNPCANTLCNTDFDCGDGCGCDEGLCKPCSAIPCDRCDSVNCACTDGVNCEPTGGDGEGCNEEVELEVKGCTLEGKLNSSTSCACDVLTTGVYTTYTKPGFPPDIFNDGTAPLFDDTPENFFDRFQLRVNLDIRQGLANSYAEHLGLKRLSELEIANALPTAWSVEIEVRARYTTTSGGEQVITRNQSVTIVDFDRISQLFTWDRAGLNTLLDYRVKVTVNSLQLPNNCKYNNILFQRTYTNDNPQQFGTLKMTSQDTKHPLFTWTRSKGSYSKVFRKVFIPPTNGQYTDTLRGPRAIIVANNTHVLTGEQGELWAGYNYTLKTDCTCAQPKTKKLVVCDIEQFAQGVQYDIENCGRRLKLLQDFVPCPVNRDVTEYANPGINYVIPTNAQVRYGLYINGELRDTFIYKKQLNGQWGVFRNNSNLIWNGRTYDSTVEIETVALYQIIDSTQEDCGIEQTVDNNNSLGDLQYEFECQTNGTAVLVVPQNNAIGFITQIKVGNTTRTNPNSGSDFRFSNLQNKQTVKVEVSVAGGCSASYDITPDCCASKSVVIEAITKNGVNLPAPLNIADNCLDAAEYIFRMTITPPAQGSVLSVSADSGAWTPFNFISQSPSTGVYTFGAVFQRERSNQTYIRFNQSLKVRVASSDCTTEHEFDVSPCNFGLRVVPNITCSGVDSTLEITADPNAVVVVSTPAGNQTYQVDNNGIFTTPVQLGGDYSIVSIDGEPITGATDNLTVVSSPTLSSITVPPTGCTGQTVTVNLTGTPGAVVAVRRSADTATVNTTLNGAGIGSVNFSYPNPGTFTVEATTISLGTCQVPANITGVIVIEQSPTLTLQNIVCSPDLLEYTANVLVNPSAATVSIISGSGNLTQSGSSVQITNIPTNTAVVIEANNGVCTSTLNIFHNCVCVQPVLSNVLPGDFCVGAQSFTNPISFTVNSPNAHVVELYLNDATDPTQLFFTQTVTGNFIHTPNIGPSTFGGGDNVVAKVYPVGNSSCFTTRVFNSIRYFAPIVTWGGNSSVCDGQQATIIANFSSPVTNYVWTVTGPFGPQVVSSPTNTLTFTPNQGGGTYIVNVQVNYGLGCSNTYTRQITVQDCCTSITSINSGNSCIASFVVANAISNSTWELRTSTNVLVDSGTVSGNSSVTINTSSLPAGFNGPLTLTIDGGNGCVVSQTFNYQRCACLCATNNVCQTAEIFVNYPVGPLGSVITETLGFFGEGATIAWAIDPDNAPDTFEVLINDVVRISTGKISNFSNCGCIDLYGSSFCSDPLLNKLAQGGYTLLVNTVSSSLIVSTSPELDENNNIITCSDGTTLKNVTPIPMTSANLLGTVGGQFNMPSGGGTVKVRLTRNSQSSGGKFRTTCVTP
jgi:hypothetical protein